MLNSGDLFLSNLYHFLFPVIILLIGNLTCSFLIIERYSKTISRLYKMNFYSSELERKRISSDLHDQLGYNMSIINKSIDSLEIKNNLENNEDINHIKLQFRLFHNEIRRVLETIHPLELLDKNWRVNIIQLSQNLSLGNTKINVVFHLTEEPKDKYIYHIYRIIQEKLSNVITHSDPKVIQIDFFKENSQIAISIVYKCNFYWIQFKSKKLLDNSGLGLKIIKDRLKIINSTNTIEYIDGHIVDTILIPL